MEDRKKLESVFCKYGLTDFKWIDPKDIVTVPDQPQADLPPCEDAWIASAAVFGKADPDP